MASKEPGSEKEHKPKEPKGDQPKGKEPKGKQAKGPDAGAPEVKAGKPSRPKAALGANRMSRLHERYQKEIAPALAKEFSYKNPMAIPRMRKIVVNIGVGEATQNVKLLDGATHDLVAITGQKPIIHRARKSIAQFKVRKGQSIGASVTLRGDRMYEFMDRLLNIALPRVRDFRGVPTKAFDGRGNYTFGIKDQLMFPEIDYAKIDKIRGMNITVVTDAKTDEEALALLRHMGVPFRA